MEQWISLILLWSAWVCAQGNRVESTRLHFETKIHFRLARTTVRGEMTNVVDESTDTSIQVFIPKDAVVTQLHVTVDGLRYQGSVVSRMPTDPSVIIPSLNATSSRYGDSMLVRVPIKIQEKGSATFTLKYQEVLRRLDGYFNHVMYLDPGPDVADLKVIIHVIENQPIVNLKASQFLSENMQSGITIKHVSDREVQVLYEPEDIMDVMAAGQDLTDNRLLLSYGLKESRALGNFQVMEHHFVHWVTSQVFQPLPLHALFLVDASRDVFRWKALQIQTALREILQGRRPHDLFEIMEFHEGVRLLDDFVDLYSSEVQRDRYRDLYTGLQGGLRHMTRLSGSTPQLIFLITGGDAQVGVRDADDVARLLQTENTQNIPIYAASIGANTSLLDKIALPSGGSARTVFEQADIPAQVLSFFHEVSAPVLSDVKLTYTGNGGATSQLTRKNWKLFNKGRDLVVAGKLRREHTWQANKEPFSVEYSLSATSVQGPIQMNQLFFIEDARRQTKEADKKDPDFDPVDSPSPNHMEDIWITLHMRELMRRYDMASPRSRKMLYHRALKFARRYGLWTPMFYYSLVPIETYPEEEKRDYAKAFGEYPRLAPAQCDPYIILPGCPHPAGPMLWDPEGSSPLFMGAKDRKTRYHQPGVYQDFEKHFTLGLRSSRGHENDVTTCSFLRPEREMNSLPLFHPEASVGFDSVDGGFPTEPGSEQVERELYSPPGLVIPLDSGQVVCISWNRSHSREVALIHDKETTIRCRISHGRLREITVEHNRPNNQPKIHINVWHIEYGKTRAPWSSNFRSGAAHLSNRKFIWAGGKYRVHRTSSSLILEQRDRSEGYQSRTGGLLGSVDKWIMKRRKLCIPYPGGALIFRTKRIRGGCHLILADGNDILTQMRVLLR